MFIKRSQTGGICIIIQQTDADSGYHNRECVLGKFGVCSTVLTINRPCAGTLSRFLKSTAALNTECSTTLTLNDHWM